MNNDKRSSLPDFVIVLTLPNRTACHHVHASANRHKLWGAPTIAWPIRSAILRTLLAATS